MSETRLGSGLDGEDCEWRGSVSLEWGYLRCMICVGSMGKIIARGRAANGKAALTTESQRSVGRRTRLKLGALIRVLTLVCVGFCANGCALFGPPRAVSQPAGVEIERDIPYATVNGRDLKLDLYVPHGADGRLPVVLWLHAGGWFRGSRSPCPVARLATRGYVVAAVEYRLSGTAAFPAQVQDVKAAVRWIRRNSERCHADPRRIGVVGASAGGTLACLLGLTAGDAELDGVNSRGLTDTGVNCVVALFPATDLERLFVDEFPPSWQMRYSVRRLLGGVEPKDKRELARQASPIHWVRPGVAPHLLIHGGNDRLIPPQHSVDFVEQLLKAEVDAHVYVVGGFSHSSRILANAWVLDRIHLFLAEHLRQGVVATR